MTTPTETKTDATYKASQSTIPPQVQEPDVETVDRPLLVSVGEVQVLFGPGTGSFNEYDDPC